MVNKPKRRGTAWETWVKKWWQENDHPEAERVVQKGAKDEGDIHLIARGDELFVFECKDVGTITLSQFLREIRTEVKNADAWAGAAVIKQRGKGPQDAYYLVPAEILKKMIR